MARDTRSRGLSIARERQLDSSFARVLAWATTIAALGAAVAEIDPQSVGAAIPPGMTGGSVVATMEPTEVMASIEGGAIEFHDTGDVVLVSGRRPDTNTGAEESRMEGATDGARTAGRTNDGVRQSSPVRLGDRWYRPSRSLRMRVTAYSPDTRSCGKFADGITASGRPVTDNGGWLVAADTRLLPFGTMISIPGYHGGRPVPVLDRGGVIKGHRLDVLYPTHERALKWGVRHLDVVVWEEVRAGVATVASSQN